MPRTACRRSYYPCLWVRIASPVLHEHHSNGSGVHEQDACQLKHVLQGVLTNAVEEEGEEGANRYTMQNKMCMGICSTAMSASSSYSTGVLWDLQAWDDIISNILQVLYYGTDGIAISRDKTRSELV